MRQCGFGTDFFACNSEKCKLYRRYSALGGRQQAGKDVPKMCCRINQRFLKIKIYRRAYSPPGREVMSPLISSTVMEARMSPIEKPSLINASTGTA